LPPRQGSEEPMPSVVQNWQLQQQGEALVLSFACTNGERISIAVDSMTAWKMSQRLGVASARVAQELNADQGAALSSIGLADVSPEERSKARSALDAEISKAREMSGQGRGLRDRRAREISEAVARQEADERAMREAAKS
jgi:hypothetical protein